MNNIQIANQTIKVTLERKYEIFDKNIILPSLDYNHVEVYSPEIGTQLLFADISQKFNNGSCSFSVTNEDSFQAASRFDNPLVMNFANAHTAGGGFRVGANAQEESLCRCSTLYASISSEKAAEMYKFNNSHKSAVESDYMLLSPYVCVFRDKNYTFLDNPFLASVITVPAPNRHGSARFVSSKKISETMLCRIRIMLRIAAKKNYKNLVLGAWGCGAFGNDPKVVAELFRTVLISEEYGKCFDNVCFAVLGSEKSKNYTSFKNAFEFTSDKC